MTETDKVFREYFQREVPKALPPLPLNSVVAPAIDRRPANQFLLAASVAALFGLGLWLSGSPKGAKPVGDAPNTLLKGAEADGKKLLEGVKDAPNP